MGNIPLDIKVDEVRAWSPATVDERMMAEGVWLESAASASKAYPDLGTGRSIIMARSRWTTFPYKDSLYVRQEPQFSEGFRTHSSCYPQIYPQTGFALSV